MNVCSECLSRLGVGATHGMLGNYVCEICDNYVGSVSCINAIEPVVQAIMLENNRDAHRKRMEHLERTFKIIK